MTISIVVEVGPNLQRLLQGVSTKLDTIILNQEKEQVSVSKLDDQIETLKAQVAKNTDAEASAVLVIQGIAAQIAKAVADATAAGATPAQLSSLAALQTSLLASDTNLAAAIVASTPVGPTLPPAPTP